MEYINMLRDPSEKAQPSVFRFDTYPGQNNMFSCGANPQEPKFINSPHGQNPPMFSNCIPQQPVLSPLAPQVPSSFSFGSPANQVSFSGYFPFHTSSHGLVDHSNPGFSDQRFRFILGKRKTDPDADILQPCKQHITEEKMAEHMSKLHISSETVTSPLEPESVKNKRLYMCEEMRKLQTEPILPASLVAHIQQPCTALVLWQPPAKVLSVLGTSKKRRLKINVIPSQKIPQISHPTKKKLVDRSERHWLQKCCLELMQDENMEVETENNCSESNTNIENDSLPSTSKKGDLVPDVTPLGSTFYEDKATETQFIDSFDLPKILDTDEKLIHFTGTKSDDSDSSKEDESIKDADESTGTGVPESVDMDGELGGMDLDS